MSNKKTSRRLTKLLSIAFGFRSYTCQNGSAAHTIRATSALWMASCCGRILPVTSRDAPRQPPSGELGSLALASRPLAYHARRFFGNFAHNVLVPIAIACREARSRLLSYEFRLLASRRHCLAPDRSVEIRTPLSFQTLARPARTFMYCSIFGLAKNGKSISRPSLWLWSPGLQLRPTIRMNQGACTCKL